jgi:hypothetical protein
MSISPGEFEIEDDGVGDELVGVAFANDWTEAEMLKGLLENGGIPSLLQSAAVPGPQIGYALGTVQGGGSCRIMVLAKRAEEARALLAETLVADENEEEEWPEIANGRHLEGGRRAGPRNYGFLGAYARIYAVAIVLLAVVLGLYLLYRAA